MRTITTLEPTWRDWIVTNVRRECSDESLVGSMVEKNFDRSFAAAVVTEIVAAMKAGGDVASEAVAQRIVDIGRVIESQRDNRAVSVGSHRLAERDAYVAEPSRLPLANVLSAGDRAVEVLVRLEKPEVLVLANVLSDGECEELIRRSEVKLARSTTIDPKTGEGANKGDRSVPDTFSLPLTPFPVRFSCPATATK